jgi:hypothetical protein
MRIRRPFLVRDNRVRAYPASPGTLHPAESLPVSGIAVIG